MKHSHSAINGRRAELLTELFFEELHASFVAKVTDDLGYDLLVGFHNSMGGINNFAIVVKATEQPVASSFSIDAKSYELLVNSNIPAMLLVVDVKLNRLYYTWLALDGIVSRSERKMINIPVTEIDDSAKEKLRRELSSLRNAPARAAA